jgi:hypothetical protein
MPNSLILGGGHGTQALSLVSGQKIFFGTWDDGGSSGFLRAIFPDSLPLGDLRAVLSARLQQSGQSDIAIALNMRSNNINQLVEQYHKLTQVLTKPLAAGFEDFLEEYYEAKLKYLLKNSWAEIPEDNLGNMVLLYLYKQGGVEALQESIQQTMGVQLDFDFVYREPVYLYGYYYDPEKSRLKILDSETLIDKWHHPVLRFTVRDASAEHPSINPRLLLDATNTAAIFLAPGSPENYLPALNDEFLKQINKSSRKVILISQLFISSKDQYLQAQIKSLASRIDNFEVWLPTTESVRAILSDTNLLMSYAVQNKFVDVFFVDEFRTILEEFLQEWKHRAAENELYELLYEVYSARSAAQGKLGNWILRPCLDVVQESDGWKHNKQSIYKAFLAVVAGQLPE